MTISKKQLNEAVNDSYIRGKTVGISVGIEQASSNLQELRKAGIVEICSAVSQLAMANAKLTYALSRITDKLL